MPIPMAWPDQNHERFQLHPLMSWLLRRFFGIAPSALAVLGRLLEIADAKLQNPTERGTS